jgi:hypothetical protein
MECQRREFMKIVKRALLAILITVVVLLIAGFAALKFFASPEKVVKSGSLKELSTEEKLEDFRYLYATLKDSFPFFEIEKDKTGFDWLANKDKFEEEIKATRNNEEFYNTLRELVMKIQNGHTGVLPPSYYESMALDYSGFTNYPWGQLLTQEGVKEKYADWGKIIKESKIILPIKIQYVEGKYVISEDFRNLKRGDIIDLIEDKAIDEYFKTNLGQYYLNYDNKRNKLYFKSSMISVDNIKDYKITVSERDGKKITEYLTSVKQEQSISATNSSSYSEEKILKENQVAYVKVRSMSGRTLESDGKKILEFFKKIKDYPYLIIDIRGNGGGTDYYWQRNIVEPLISDTKSYSVAMAYKGNYIKPFLLGRGITTKTIDKLPEYFKSKYASEMERFNASSRSFKPENSISFKGKIFLLVDDYVYSSSESFAAFSKASGFAELVGITTGGDGIGIDPCLLALPNSGLVVRFSLDMGINSDGTVNEKEHTKPNIYVETSYEDFLQGEDSILSKALELCK